MTSRAAVYTAFAFAALQMADILSTFVAMQAGAPEINPAVVAIMATGGWWLIALFKLTLALVAIVALARTEYLIVGRAVRATVQGLSVILAFVVASNIGVIVQ